MTYPSNSRKVVQGNQKREKRIKSPVIEGKVMQRKKPLGKRVLGLVIQGDPKQAGQAMVFDALIPSIAAVILDGIKLGLDRLFLGDKAPVRRSTFAPTGQGTFGQTAYNKVIKPAITSSMQKPAPTPLTWQDRAAHNFDEIVLPERGDIEEVIGTLQECINEYGMARVSDLYDKLGITSEFTDDAWGWLELDGAGARYQTGGGYLLVLPRPVPLN